MVVADRVVDLCFVIVCLLSLYVLRQFKMSSAIAVGRGFKVCGWFLFIYIYT